MKKMVIFALFCISFIVSNAQAMLNLELQTGSKNRVPLALVGLKGNASAVIKQRFLKIIHDDLQNSGWFQLIELHSGSTLAALRESGANAALVGKINRLQGNEWQVDLTLTGLYGSTALGDQLLRVSDEVKKGHLRALAHRLSDQVFQQLTGVRGDFSTHLAYVTARYPKNAYASYRLWVSDYDGHNPQLLLKSYDPILSPAWSPDGQYLAYVAFNHHRAQIYRQSLRTGVRQRLIASPGINSAPTFSPDGKHLALVLSRTGSPKIYDLLLSTGRLTELTHGASIDTEPTWSPDGRTLLFTSNRFGNPQIFSYEFGSGTIKPVTDSGVYNARPRWLPSGVAFVMMHRTRHESGFCIAKQALSGGEPVCLTSWGKNESPSVSPNGQMLVYARDKGLAQVSLDGDVRLAVPGGAREVTQSPAWSPFSG